MNYVDFLDRKTQLGCDHGFEPSWMPSFLFDFQKSLVEWACRKGRAAIFADCGLGKTSMQLTWAENVVCKTDGRVLTPFMGVGSEVYGAVINGRKGIGIELKPSYYKQAVRNLELAHRESDYNDLFNE